MRLLLGQKSLWFAVQLSDSRFFLVIYLQINYPLVSSANLFSIISNLPLPVFRNGLVTSKYQGLYF